MAAFFCNFIPQNFVMRLVFSLIFLLSASIGFSQTYELKPPFTAIDSLYREDQFYTGITYNLLREAPENMVQKGFSFGLSGGFMRDMPINKSRTIAIASGLGISYDKYFQNLVISEENGQRNYQITDAESYSKNKLEQIFVDLPIEFRLRNSTPTTYKFWRFYAGFRFRYSVFSKSKYSGQGITEKVLYNPDLNSFQYGPCVSFGHNTINFYGYYALNPLFKSSVQSSNGQSLNTLQNFNFGLMFYIL